MKKAIIFDMDGVLVQSEQFYYDRRMAFFRQNKIVPDTTDFNAFLGASEERIWELLVHDPQQRPSVKAEYQIFRQKHEIYYPDYLTHGAFDTLHDLAEKDVKTALASAGAMSEIQRMLKECDIAQFFDEVVSGETVKHNKPDPEVYLHTLHQLRQPAEDCIAVEDSVNGITAAKAAHIETWALRPTGYTINQSEADVIIDRVSDVLAALK